MRKVAALVPMKLVALDDGSDILLDRPRVVVGRHPACDVRLDSLRVSRHHCCFTRANEEVMVRDLGSTNGIRINGQRVDVGLLKPGDELSIAHHRYRVEDDPDGGDGIPRRPIVSDLLSPNSRIGFISRN
jgi:pSer/pThr/pTyr-binding forkhead associated (FHA) protein